MKTSKAPEAAVDVSPSQKKLKQARLPFKILSDVAPAPAAPHTRKRKHSAQDNEVASKVGRLSKENDVVEALVVISDDESKDGQKEHKADNRPNPFVKLVDTAMKKKLSKSKSQKKRKNSKKNTETEVCIEPICELTTESSDETDPATIAEKKEDEPMEVDECDLDKCNKEKSTLINIEEPTVKTSTVIESENKEDDPNIISLDNSNDSSDCKSPNPGKEAHKNNNKPKIVSPSNIKPVTPKRKLRKQNSNTDETDKSSFDISTSSSKLDESITSAPSTPKQTRSSSVTNSQDDSLNKSLTPKQLQRKLEFAKKRDEKEKEKQEREKKRQQEKEEREQVRKEKEDQKKKEREEKEETKRKEREEKEEQRKKEKEEKERQKEVEKRLREEKEESKKKEREEKEEQRRKEKEAREEEKRKKQEAVDLEKQEQDMKKKKAAEAFVNFFVPKQKVEKDQVIGPAIKNNMLSSFTLKADMRLAPTVRHELTEEKKNVLEQLLISQQVPEKDLYVERLKNTDTKPLSCGKTWPLEDKDDDVMVVEEDLGLAGVGVISCESARERLRPKLLSFHENRRPAYWGTWRRRSRLVGPRRPLARDQKHLDYSVDSASDWEEEAEGESLDGSAAGSDAEPEPDDYELDNELFVPHGYLSDEEATMDEDDVMSLSPEAQKAKLEQLSAEFESEMKKPTEKLKPRLFGLIWANSNGGKPDNCVDALWDYFQKYAMIMNDPTPLLQPSVEPEEEKKNAKKEKKKKQKEGEQPSPKSEKKKKQHKESKKAKVETKNTPEVKKNQLGINSFLTKLKSA